GTGREDLLQTPRAPSGVLMQPESGRDGGIARLSGTLGVRVGIDHEAGALLERRRGGRQALAHQGKGEQKAECKPSDHFRVVSGTNFMRRTTLPSSPSL